METFSALLALCVGNSPVAGEFPTQMSVTRKFDVSFDLNWVNNREAGDLRRNRPHYDVILMESSHQFISWIDSLGMNGQVLATPMS